RPSDTPARIVDALGPDVLGRAALSAAAMEAFGPSAGALDRGEFWKHSLAVAVAAELAAGQIDDPPAGGLAFACGLLHDIGKLALDASVPKSYRRVLSAVRAGTGSIARVEREIMGLDHALAGRRVGQRWRLPRRIEEAIWLHHYPLAGQGHRLDDAGLIALIQMADIIARYRGIGFSGNYADTAGSAELIELAGLTPVAVAAVADALPDAFQDSLWLIDRPAGPAPGAPRAAPDSADRPAGDVPGCRGPGELLQALSGFVAGLSTAAAAGPLCARIAELYAACFPQADPRHPTFAFHVAADHSQAVLIPQASDPNGRSHAARCRPAPPPAARPLPAGDALKGLLDPADAWYGHVDLDRYTLLPLTAGDRWLGGILVAGPQDPENLARDAFCDFMAFVLAAAIDRDRADRLAEDLALSSQHLSETREALAQAQVFEAIAEMAAGAAHEINNPLAVISSRAQKLAGSAAADERAAAEQIVAKAEEISQIAVDLLEFARPAAASPAWVPVAELLEPVKDQAISEAQSKQDGLRVDICIWPDCPPVWVDADQIRGVLTELIGNAARAGEGRVNIRLEASAENESQHVVIRVVDDGPGMAEDVVASAFTPFFSHRPAGRRKGMGLPRARRCVRSNGGRIWIKSRPGGGTTVSLQLPRAPGDVST
ncbi:MAG: HDOD domain-containing protein, partial [Planctomycetota bacterium]